ncbi:MAG: hypothetical protein M3017_17315 [Actinomycetota bacterium]|nr:hypothetical protein [Actinomycetota bacterium]
MAHPQPGAEESTLARCLAAVAAVVPAVAVATALLVYFGWARSDAEARSMGLDANLFGYTALDYVLGSLRSLFLPLVLLVIVAIVWLAGEVWLTARTRSNRHRRFIQRTSTAAMFVGMVAAGGGLLVSLSLPDQAAIFLPYVMAAGVLVAAWGLRLRRATAAPHPVAGMTPNPEVDAAAADPEAAVPTADPEEAVPTADPEEAVPTADPEAAVPIRPRTVRQHAIESTLVFTLATLLLFWGTTDFAQAVGRGRAVQIEQSVDSMPRATVISGTKLGIGAPNVREQAIGTATAPLYQYRGLRLLVVSGGRFFFLHNGWTLRSGAVVVLPDDGHVRVELGN